jgi:hypothetical protein
LNTRWIKRIKSDGKEVRRKEKEKQQQAHIGKLASEVLFLGERANDTDMLLPTLSANKHPIFTHC